MRFLDLLFSEGRIRWIHHVYQECWKFSSTDNGLRLSRTALFSFYLCMRNYRGYVSSGRSRRFSQIFWAAFWDCHRHSHAFGVSVLFYGSYASSVVWYRNFPLRVCGVHSGKFTQHDKHRFSHPSCCIWTCRCIWFFLYRSCSIFFRATCGKKEIIPSK